jgi:hypothetical protein
MLVSLFFFWCHWRGIEMWSSSSSGYCDNFFKAWAMPRKKSEQVRGKASTQPHELNNGKKSE